MDQLKLLFVGNSFAVDTAQYAVEIARSLGVQRVTMGVLFVGGCSIEMHYAHAMEDIPAYVYHLNEGEGWSSTPDCRISDAVKGDEWDWIVIQHGTHGAARYTSPECYEKLAPLVSYLKQLASAHTRIAFNLTWMGESTRQHHEILSYGGDIALMRKRLEETTREAVLKTPGVDLLIPTGTAIENARTTKIGLLTRDCYHLSMDKGRYIAGLALVSTVTGISADRITWAPDRVDEYAVRVAVEAVKWAQVAPLRVTPLDL
jgi:hypothetical protein